MVEFRTSVALSSRTLGAEIARQEPLRANSTELPPFPL
jgi:hypothetical protein